MTQTRESRHPLCNRLIFLLFDNRYISIRHPSNEFFYQFANAIPFDSEDSAEFVRVLAEVYAKPPLPLAPSERRALSWAAATDRLADAMALPASTVSSASSPSVSSSLVPSSSPTIRPTRPSQTGAATAAYLFHRFLSAGWLGLFLRDATGAIPELPDAAAHALWSLLGASSGSADRSITSSTGSESDPSEQGASADRGVVARQAMVTGTGLLGIILSAVTSMESALAENYQPSPCDGSAPLLLAKLHDKAEVCVKEKRHHFPLPLPSHLVVFRLSFVALLLNICSFHVTFAHLILTRFNFLRMSATIPWDIL